MNDDGNDDEALSSPPRDLPALSSLDFRPLPEALRGTLAVC